MEDILRRIENLDHDYMCPDLRHHEISFFNLELPTFEVKEDVDHVEIDLSPIPHSATSTIGSTIRDVMKVRSKEIPNIVHDMTVGHLCDGTDRKFSSVFPIKNDGFDSNSPDMIIQSQGGTCYVVEFTTNRGGEGACRVAAQTKISKYEIPCRNRSSDFRVVLIVIAVHRDGVWSNVDLTDDEVNELCYRFRLAVDIFETLKLKLAGMDEDDAEMTKMNRELTGIVSLINMDWEKTTRKFPMFKREVFEKFESTPVDEDYMSRMISRMLGECQDEMMKESFLDGKLTMEERIELNKKECNDAIDSYISEYMSNDFMRDETDPKSTIQIPPWLMYEGDRGKGLGSLGKVEVDSVHPMGKIWSKVVQSATLEEIERMYDDPLAELEFAMSDQTDRPDEKTRYHRVKVDLSYEELEYASCLGVRGKEHKDGAAQKEHRLRSKKAFSINHDVRDLEAFLNDNDRSMFRPTEDLYNILSEDWKLRQVAASIHQPTMVDREGGNEILDNHKEFMTTPLGSWTQMVSVIGAELSASVKQHVKPSFYIVKRLLNSPFYMLIKPTSSSGHIFVSFALDKAYWYSDLGQGRIFKSYIDCGGLLVTDFVSYKLSKLTNLCKTNSLVEAALNFWTEAYGFVPWNSVKITSTDRSSSAADVCQMVKFSMLTLLEDKAQTEELQTLMRYVMMEGFVSQPELPKPHKMIKKLPYILRSELQVLLLNRVFQSMRRVASRPFCIQKRAGQISWSSLFNPLSLSDVKDIQPVISSCYNGYFKNKEEETEPTVLSKMYKKIIELEHLCPDDDKYLGSGDPEDPKMHEFSRSYLKQCTEHAKQLLSRIHGTNFMKLIQDQIMREINSLTLERLATLKATSNFNDSWYEYKDISKERRYSRDKLIVKMSEFASTGSTLAIEKFEDCMRTIEDRGAMHICLFKKQQHGGLREIYVMGAEERIVQSIVEAIAKSIGSFFPSDTLCNPPNKVKIPETHGIRARKHCKGPVWTTATSDDAKKWNQGHFVTKFAMMLKEFTDPMWWPIIVRGCSMFTNKRMMMNVKFLDVLFSSKAMDIQDEFVQTAHKAFHGEINVPWMEAGKTYLTTKTGMMQGILHFTSSLLHTIHQEFIRSLTPKIFNQKVAPEMSYKIVVDMMQGSDDSSMIISFPSQDEMIIGKCKVAASISFRMKRKLGILLCIIKSEKGTTNTDFAMEYNSEFYFHSQHVRPTIRWVAASCSLPEVETLVARQEEAANLLTSVTEGGGSFSLASCIQQSQCTIHYMLMGMGVSELFYEYRKAVLRWKDPGLGFFLLDNPYAAGLGGFRYNLYKAITCTDLQKIYAYFMKKVRKNIVETIEEEDEESNSDTEDAGSQVSGSSSGSSSTLEPEACSVSPGGALILSSSLKWGSREKFRKLRERLKIPQDWADRINENPVILYRAPQTGEEIILRIAEKIHSPGVVSSLSSGNSVAKVMASAVYFLSAAIFQDSGNPEFSILGSTKYSLLHKMAMYEGFGNGNNITKEDILFLFPNVEELQNLDSVVFNRGRIDYAHRINQREATQTRVIVFEEHHNFKVAAEKLVSDKWFGTQKSKLGGAAFSHEWERLKAVIPWLADNPNETLDQSPLRSHIQIKNFFARMENKARVVRITGAPVKKRSGVSKMAMVIRDNFVKCGYLRDVDDSIGMERSSASEVMKHFLFCTLQGPYTDEDKKQTCLRLFQELPEIIIKDSDKKTRSNVLGIFQHWANSPEGTLKKIESAGAGTIGGFVCPQKPFKDKEGKIRYKGDGVWRGTMDGHQIQIDITSSDTSVTYITGVTIQDSCSVWDIGPSIRAWAEDAGISNSVDVARRKRHNKPRYWLFDFRPFGADKPYGAPIFVTRGRLSEISVMRESDLKLKVRRSTINLYVKDQGRDMHVLSYTAHDNDLSPLVVRNSTDKSVQNVLASFQKEPSRSWYRCEALQVPFLNVILDLAEGKRQIKSIDSERLSQIIKICTESCLRSKIGSAFQYVPGSSGAPLAIDIDSIMNLVLEETNIESFERVAKGIAEDLEGSYMSDKFDFTDIDLFGPAHYKENMDLTMVSHPLMDDFINSLISLSTRRDIRKVLETGMCTKRDEVMFKLLFRSLGRDPESVRVEYHFPSYDEEVDEDMIG
ncbi:RNA-dependent RNA polymerase [Urucuri virus]|uniref:RNA-directed RNA polymerase L n=1 Tax=Urucuri virus TaxID=1926502 RepID=A0A1S5SHW3_9VIRU|nr:RNA-dependent RNA polymerase [Urucuri virus]API68900.1 RNA-dependent RNA polymerase [Urucuri virus]